MSKHIHTWLALGDSYTVGEGVPLFESFPYQALYQLRKGGLHFHAPEIVAKTGWTTFELAEQILHSPLQTAYDFVTLLAGVNNQYRGLALEDYKNDFEFLVKKAIHLAGERAERVVVLSIPNWGLTPFAASRDTEKITREIAAFNQANRQLAGAYKVHYVDITSNAGNPSTQPELVTNDTLHPSAKEYKRWATLVVACMRGQVS